MLKIFFVIATLIIVAALKIFGIISISWVWVFLSPVVVFVPALELLIKIALIFSQGANKMNVKELKMRLAKQPFYAKVVFEDHNFNQHGFSDNIVLNSYSA